MTTPERYNLKEVLCTYLETKNITLYAHGPVGTEPIGQFLQKQGSRTMLAYCKPWHWANVTTEYTHHTHILVLRDPVEQHKHGGDCGCKKNRKVVSNDLILSSTHVTKRLLGQATDTA